MPRSAATADRSARWSSPSAYERAVVALRERCADLERGAVAALEHLAAGNAYNAQEALDYALRRRGAGI